LAREVEFAGTAAGVGDAEQVEQPDDANGTEVVVAEGFHQIEDEIRLAPPQTGVQLRHVLVDGEDIDLVAVAAQGTPYLADHVINVLGTLLLDMSENGDLHSSNSPGDSGSVKIATGMLASQCLALCS